MKNRSSKAHDSRISLKHVLYNYIKAVFLHGRPPQGSTLTDSELSKVNKLVEAIRQVKLLLSSTFLLFNKSHYNV